ncbi:actin-related protein 9 isoform X1 [Rhododendron vialii]|uniref:actin-related protein 9 isoform X1 n=1 Tax=Rhododendron vialii TaxID=182163 RepID=UPI00265D82A7|nr:actin-related protein 9 isoform X1 [Rhododendron vialii]XP_058211953.1 actin-related protein 9 isoform X1 [Rhododendron vialii]XP_058211954.1 actin-related protein 9 isoform X1 [Rhododendron vialii]
MSASAPYLHYQDYLKTAVASQLLSERGSNLVVINPGSANIRIGLAQQDVPFNIPHCIARRTTGANQAPKKIVQDQLLNSQVTTAQHVEREKAYDSIASLLKIPFLDEEVANNSFTRKMGRADGYANTPQSNRKEIAFTWTNVLEKKLDSSSTLPDSSPNKGEVGGPTDLKEGTASKELGSSECKLKEYICGEEALRISPTEPYCLRRPIRRGHLNVSLYYPMQQVFEDLQAIWDWILIEKLHVPHSERNMFSVVLVVPETFDSREIKEMLSIILRDLHFSSAVVHQEGLAAVFGNGLSTACAVNIGAQVTSVICIEDGVALPTTQMTLRFGGEDISRCLLWTQRHHQTWPPIRTDALAKPVDLLMLNRLKEAYCQIKEGEVEALAVVHSYEDGMPAGSHKTRLAALNVPPMGLFYPMLLVPDVYPPPPRSWFNDYEDMLEDTWHMEFPRRTDLSDGFYPSLNGGFPMWDSYPSFQTKPKKEDNIGLAEAITKSILSTGRIDLQRKLFCSIQLIGGVALTAGLISAVEERVLHAIPSHEAIDTVEVLQSRANPAMVPWKGGAILGVLDFGREAWIHREDWIRNGIHIGSGRKYKDSYFLQAQAMCYMNS